VGKNSWQASGTFVHLINFFTADSDALFISRRKPVIDAYSKSIQGFFVKPSNFQDLKSIMKIIVEYWQKCESPNYVK